MRTPEKKTLTGQPRTGRLLNLKCRRALCSGLFLSFINDLSWAVPGCGVRLFADDCVLYRPVSSQADCEALQTDFCNVEAWERKWCMSLNLDKCNIMTVTRKINKIIHKYKLH